MSDESPCRTLALKLVLVLLGFFLGAVLITILSPKKVQREYVWSKEGSIGVAHAAVPVHPDQIMHALRNVRDPEIDINIVDLGLIYNVKVDGDAAAITMTLTSPSCPYGAELIKDVKTEVFKERIRSLRLNITFDPPWTISRIGPEAGKKLFGAAWRAK